MARRLRNRAAALAFLEPGHVVHLKADAVAKSVGEERRRDARLDGALRAHFDEAVLAQDVRERVMRVPLVSTAQVRMLAEGLTEPLPPTPFVEENLAPQMPFTDEQIRAGLPEPRPFGTRDLRCCVN